VAKRTGFIGVGELVCRGRPRADLSPYGLSVAVDWSESWALRGPRRYVPQSQGVSTVALRGMSESEAGGR